MARLLVIDDEPALRDAIVMVLQAAGHAAHAVATGEDGLLAHAASPFDALVVDITLPGLSGIDVVRRIRKTSPDVPVVFITAHSSIASAVEAIRAGGFDYLPKPFDNDELVLKVDRAIAHRQLNQRVHTLERDLQTRTSFPAIVGQSAAITEVTRTLAKVAPTDVTVLITGESGTGKELAARSIHRHSPRSGGPFVAINCGAIPATLAESELFGHERGAFTDAKGERLGVFERARSGTLFLDEVGDLPLDLQVKLLRVLQEGELVRVGGSRPITVDVRVVAATNRDLPSDVRAGLFRDDLFWRLNVVSVAMPPLRERRDDLPLLIEHLLALVNAECRSEVQGLTASAMAAVRAHHWPGNVRELLNALRRGAIMTEGDQIDLPHLPASIVNGAADDDRKELAALQDALAETERRAIEAALASVGGNRDRAAQALGISRRTLFNKLKRARDRDGNPV